jgi:hypothetical protein
MRSCNFWRLIFHKVTLRTSSNSHTFFGREMESFN